MCGTSASEMEYQFTDVAFQYYGAVTTIFNGPNTGQAAVSEAKSVISNRLYNPY